MLFNSYPFLFGFLPLVLIGTVLLARAGRGAIAWVALASVAFYAWWDARAVPLLLGSVAFNFVVAGAIQGARDEPGRRRRLAAGVAGNLLLLGIFKYTAFLVESFNAISGLAVPVPHVVLPLGISFFTFTQIAFLVDLSRGQAARPDAPRYLLFVTYFPHLIAGPLYHHSQVMPQLERPVPFRITLDNLHIGAVLLCVGLFKKCVIADSLAPYAAEAFGGAGAGSSPGLLVAWAGALAFGLQIYFDFSGYSDMALGLARMMGIRLPLNFWSPYKAASIIDFWRRWHMTLSAFLRDYLYIPLGGNRRGEPRRYVNILLTMVLGGLWHGAAWTFVLWGFLHGVLLCLNHAWRKIRPHAASAAWTRVGIIATFLAVTWAWIPFRADGMTSVVSLFAGTLGVNGLGATPAAGCWAWLAAAACITFLAPNANEYVASLEERPLARPVLGTLSGAAIGVMAFMAFNVIARKEPSPFLYFNF